MSKEIIVISNHKGGCAKTETAVNLACAIQRDENKVLLIDADSQGSATLHFGFSPYDIQNNNEPRLFDDIATLLECREKGIPYEYSGDSILHSYEGVDLIAGTEDLKELYSLMPSLPDADTVFTEYVAGLKDKYDYIIIDEHPNLSAWELSILKAATRVNIPIMPDKYAANGMASLYGWIRENDRTIPISCEFCIVEEKNPDAGLWIDEVLNKYSGLTKIHKTYIPRNTNIARSKEFGVSVLTYDPNGIGAKKYFALAEELLGRPIKSRTLKLDIDVDEIDPDKDRKNSASEELIEDIRKNGIRERLTVREKRNGRYEVVHGDRRLDAARKIGLETIPCEIIKITLNDIPKYRKEMNKKG